MKNARIIPLALMVACLVAATPSSWGAGHRATAAGESQRKPWPVAHRLLEVVDFVAGAAGMVRITRVPPREIAVDSGFVGADVTRESRVRGNIKPIVVIEPEFGSDNAFELSR